MTRLRRTWLVTAALLVTAGSTLAQDDEETRRHGIFIDSLDVSLINVEVYVTRDGEPVAGLTADDFEILDDGEPVEITNFYRVESGQRLAAVDGETEDDVVAAETDAAQPPEPSAVVVLVDHPFIAVTSRKFVFDSLAEQLDRLLGDGTRVMVVAKDRRVEVVQQPTVNRDEIVAALDRESKVATFDYASEVQRVVRSIMRGGNVIENRSAGPGTSAAPLTQTALSDARTAFQDARIHSEQVFSEVGQSLSLLRSFLGSLAGLPGRKAVLYAADRLPARAGELVWQAWVEKYGVDWGSRLGVTSADAALKDYDASVAIRELIADANANRVAFYPIGSGAAAGPNLAGAEAQGLTTSSRPFVRTTERNGTLHWLAQGTGGRVAMGRGDVASFFDELHQDLTHYYSLGYPSPHRGDGKTHRVEVRLRDPRVGEGMEVRYLAEYRDKSADQQVEERTLAALVLGVSDNPLDVRVTLGDSKKQKEGHFLVPMEIRLPIANLVLLPDKKAHWGKVTIQLIVRDEAGRFSDPVRIRMPLEIPHAAMVRALSETVTYNTEVAMRRGRQTIAVGVRDEHGATNSTVSVGVEVGGRG